MRSHSRYSVSTTNPRAKGVCARCGFEYQHDQLQWQFQWAGPRLQNLQILVCCECLDVPQEQLRTIILPPDPIPIENPRPENYTSDNNPASSLGTSIGTLTGFGGLAAAFDSSLNKPFNFCAAKGTSVAGYNNSAGRNFGSGNNYSMAGFKLYAPNNTSFMAGATPYKIQGSSNGTIWTDLYTANTAGSIGEEIFVTLSSPTNQYQYFRVNFSGDGVSQIGLAQFMLYASGSSFEGEQ